MRKVAGNCLGCTVGPLTGPWGITIVILGEILRVILRVVYDSYDGNGSGR